MKAELLAYDLPSELIAQQPAPTRTGSRLLVLDDSTTGYHIGSFASTLLHELRPGDLVVANDSRVLHARLHLVRPGGGAAELLLLDPDGEPGLWRAMARPGKRLRAGMLLTHPATGEQVQCVERTTDGLWIIRIPAAGDDVERWLTSVGELPLPPYIHPNRSLHDRYQTVHANDAGSVAAPTAGLHFDDELWTQVRQKCEVAYITLHVGAGTFQPIRVDDLNDHEMHAERYTVPDATHTLIEAARRSGRRIVAIGTTTTRVLESVYGSAGMPRSGSTNIFIQPGDRLECVGALLTNFHLPGSTLLALVMACAGIQRTRDVYQAAIAERMRFYSFGDAMLIPDVGSTRG